LRHVIDIAQKGIALGLLFVLTLNMGRISTDIMRQAEYTKEILRDLDRLADNGVNVVDVRRYDE
jgi:hypothetical protein